MQTVSFLWLLGYSRAASGPHGASPPEITEPKRQQALVNASNNLVSLIEFVYMFTERYERHQADVSSHAIDPNYPNSSRPLAAAMYGALQCPLAHGCSRGPTARPRAASGQSLPCAPARRATARARAQRCVAARGQPGQQQQQETRQQAPGPAPLREQNPGPGEDTACSVCNCPHACVNVSNCAVCCAITPPPNTNTHRTNTNPCTMQPRAAAVAARAGRMAPQGCSCC